jgi:membrane-associated phospholipid phosphatase
MTPFDVLVRLATYSIYMAVLAALYWLSQQPVFGPMHALPFTALDRAIPFIPETSILYSSLTVLIGVAVLTAPRFLDLRRVMASLLLVTGTCTACFALWPVVYPRELFPIPDRFNLAISWLMDTREVDHANNCMPSLHVALAVVCGYWLYRSAARRPWLRAAAAGWAAAICATTLTTKQHYAVDVLAGALVGAAACALVARLLVDRHPGPTLSLEALGPGRPAAEAVLEKLLASVRKHQWSLDEITFDPEQRPPLPEALARFLNQLVYIEESAGIHFQFLSQASVDPRLQEAYQFFAVEERRHAEAFRRLLAHHGAGPRYPALGISLQLNLYDRLSPDDPLDALLVAMAIPVFETLLDGAIIPMCERLAPELDRRGFTAIAERISRDEHSHLALNWLVVESLAVRGRLGRGLRYLLHPNVWRGAASVPLMAFDVFSLAGRLGFDFGDLLPLFRRIFRLDRDTPALRRFLPWELFKFMCICASIAAWTCVRLQRLRLLDCRWIVRGTRLLDASARLLFGRALLERHGLPEV